MLIGLMDETLHKSFSIYFNINYKPYQHQCLQALGKCKQEVPIHLMVSPYRATVEIADLCTDSVHRVSD